MNLAMLVRGKRRIRPSTMPLAIATIAALVLTLLIGVSPSLSAATASPPRVLGWGVGQVAAIAVAGGHVWIADPSSDSITELDAANGAYVRTLSAPSYGFDDPSLIGSNGSDVWVVDSSWIAGTPGLTEFDATTGARIRFISGATVGVTEPISFSDDGSELWIGNEAGTIQELSASTGALVREVTSTAENFQTPDIVTSDGASVWVADDHENSVTQLDESTGAFVRTITLPSEVWACGLQSDGPDLWVAEGSSLGVYGSSSGQLVRTVAGPSTGFEDACSVSVGSSGVWVLSQNTLSEIAPSSGHVLRVLALGTTSAYPASRLLARGNGDLWEVNVDSVGEFNASSGQRVRMVYGSPYDFRNPSAITSAGGDVWVVGSQSLTELSAGHRLLHAWVEDRLTDNDFESVVANRSFVWIADGSGVLLVISASTGKVLHAYSGGLYGIDGAMNLAIDASHVWAVGSFGNTITELSSVSGRFIRVIKGARYQIVAPSGVASNGSDVWILNELSVTEISAATDRLVRVIQGSADHLNNVESIIADASHVWVTSWSTTSTVSQFSAASGHLQRVLQIPCGCGTSIPVATSSDGTHIWVAFKPETSTPETGNVVTESSIATGSELGIRSGPAYRFSEPSGIVTAGTDVWVANEATDTVTVYPS
jgi:hypothetical protein